jgi:hypothetical protein
MVKNAKMTMTAISMFIMLDALVKSPFPLFCHAEPVEA